jgi:hypothetical protein
LTGEEDVRAKESGEKEVSFDEAIDKIFAGDTEGLKRKHFNVRTPDLVQIRLSRF